MNIDINEFTPIDSIQLKYSVEDPVFLQLAEFFCNHEQGKLYSVDADSNTNVLDKFREETYQEYGIFFSKIPNLLIGCKFMLILEPIDFETIDILRQKVTSEKERYKITTFSSVIIMGDIDEQDTEIYSDLLKQVIVDFDKVHFLNRCILNVAKMIITDSKCDIQITEDYFDIAPILEKYSLQNPKSEHNRNYKNIRLCYEELRELGDSDTIFYYSGSDTVLKNVFAGIAALLIIRDNRKVATTEHLLKHYLKMFRSRKFNYLKHYLEQLKDPLELGLVQREYINFIAILDLEQKSRDEERYKVKITCSQIEFNLNERNISNNLNVDSVTYDVDQLEILEIQDLFGLSAKGFTECKQSLDEINRVLARFEHILLSKKLISEDDDSLNLTNTLLYRVEDKYYLAYVSYISSIMPYLIVEYPKGIPVKIELNLLDTNLTDVRIIEEYQILVDWAVKQKQLIPGNNCFYKCHDYYVGLLVYLIEAKEVIFTEESNFTMEEIGIWSIQTSSFRRGMECNIIKILPKQNLWDNFLTFYGGKHPAVSVKYMVDASTWRYKYV